jgi:hypothetical protein
MAKFLASNTLVVGLDNNCLSSGITTGKQDDNFSTLDAANERQNRIQMRGIKSKIGAKKLCQDRSREEGREEGREESHIPISLSSRIRAAHQLSPPPHNSQPPRIFNRHQTENRPCSGWRY